MGDVQQEPVVYISRQAASEMLGNNADVPEMPVMKLTASGEYAIDGQEARKPAVKAKPDARHGARKPSHRRISGKYDALKQLSHSSQRSHLGFRPSARGLDRFHAAQLKMAPTAKSRIVLQQAQQRAYLNPLPQFQSHPRMDRARAAEGSVANPVRTYSKGHGPRFALQPRAQVRRYNLLRALTSVMDDYHMQLALQPKRRPTTRRNVLKMEHALKPS